MTGVLVKAGKGDTERCADTYTVSVPNSYGRAMTVEARHFSFLLH